MSGLSPISASPEIHRAEWVAPVAASPLRNGAVLIRGGRVISAGPFADIKKNSPAGARLVDHGRAVLFPALVNAHTHLEFSVLRGKIPFPQPGFREWIELLFALRAGTEPLSIHEGLHSGEAELLSCGTGLFADITNGGAVVEPSCAAIPERRIFLELLGFNLGSIAAAIPPEFLTRSRTMVRTGRAAKKEDSTWIPVPHSVYSVSPAIIAECKEWTRTHELPFSIHVAEHLDEIEFLHGGKGFCRELLQRLGRWEPAWKPPGKTPLKYLDSLGALDSRTLLVHAVHMTEADWALAAKRDCNVVFCPRSNRNLGSGRPWIEKALSLGINCALGTDSLASNGDLNLFAEAGFVLDEYPSIDPRRVLEMITVNPARALGRKGDFGSIEPGAKAYMLSLEIQSCLNESNLAESLIRSGEKGTWKWVNRAQS